MHQIDGDGAVGGLFVGETTSSEGTQVTPEWLNAVQAELLNVIEAAGITPDKDNNAQLLAALQALGLSSGGGNGPIRFSLPGAVSASATRLVAALAGSAGNITRMGGRVSGSGSANITVKADGMTVATWNVDTTTGTSNIAGSLANTAVTELSQISLYVNSVTTSPEDLMVFITIEPSE